MVPNIPRRSRRPPHFPDCAEPSIPRFDERYHPLREYGIPRSMPPPAPPPIPLSPEEQEYWAGIRATEETQKKRRRYQQRRAERRAERNYYYAGMRRLMGKRTFRGLASETGFGAGWIHNVLTGRVRDPGIHNVVKLAKALGVPVQTLYQHLVDSLGIHEQRARDHEAGFRFQDLGSPRTPRNRHP